MQIYAVLGWGGERKAVVVSKAGTNPGVLFETFIATSSILKWISIFEDFCFTFLPNSLKCALLFSWPC